MKKMKRTKKAAIVSACLAAAIAVSGALAFFTDSDTKANRFSFTDTNGEQTIDVHVDEPNWKEKDGENILPGDTVSKDPVIVNDGEEDAYGFITVLVPTAKSIDLDDGNGIKSTKKDVELFWYEINDGWKEIDKTDGAAVDTTNNLRFTYNDVNGTRTVRPDVVTTESVAGAHSDNVYYTAHTFAYVGDDADTMQAIKSGETTTPSVFKNLIDLNTNEAVKGGVRMINVSDGEKLPMTLQEVFGRFVPAAGATLDETQSTETSKVFSDGTTVTLDAANGKITASKTTQAEGQEPVTTTKTVYTTVTEGTAPNQVTWVIDENGNKQTKMAAQLTPDDNMNIYVTGYAIQAANLGTADPDAVWAICANANQADADATSAVSDFAAFYAAPVIADPGDKSAANG